MPQRSLVQTATDGGGLNALSGYRLLLRYEVHDRQLVINEAEATTVRHAIEEAGCDSAGSLPFSSRL